MLVVWLMFILAIVIALVSFSAFNMEMIILTLAPGKTFLLPLYSIVLFSLLAGVMIAWILSLIDRIALAARLRAAEQDVRKLRDEVQGLRSLALEEDRKGDREETRNLTAKA